MFVAQQNCNKFDEKQTSVSSEHCLYVSKAHDRFLFLSVLIFCLILSKNAAFRVIFRSKISLVQINILTLHIIHAEINEISRIILPTARPANGSRLPDRGLCTSPCKGGLCVEFD